MSVYYDCLTAAQVVIQGIGLTGIADERILIRKLPWVRGVDIPCVLLSPIGDYFPWANNSEIEAGYGIHVVAIQASNQNLTGSHDAVLYWRQQMIDALVADKLSAVSSVVNLTIEPSGLILPEAFQKQYDASAFVARCVSRETISA